RTARAFTFLRVSPSVATYAYQRSRSSFPTRRSSDLSRMIIHHLQDHHHNLRNNPRNRHHRSIGRFHHQWNPNHFRKTLSLPSPALPFSFSSCAFPCSPLHQFIRLDTNVSIPTYSSRSLENGHQNLNLYKIGLNTRFFVLLSTFLTPPDAQIHL